MSILYVYKQELKLRTETHAGILIANISPDAVGGWGPGISHPRALTSVVDATLDFGSTDGRWADTTLMAIHYLEPVSI